jgi:RNA polymerase sigma-70 factor (ECF subfamily)
VDGPSHRLPQARHASSPPSDEQLLASFLGGDVRAFDLLVERHAGRVYAICYRYFGNASDAEDAAQEAFVALLRRGGTFRGQAGFSTWLFRVAMNTCHDLARKRARRPRSADTDVATLVDHGDEDLLANCELALELRQALATLDPGQRRLITLHDIHGLPYAEVAKQLGMPIGTVKSRIHRAHARLATSLAHLRGNPPSREPTTATDPPTTGP